MLKKVLILMSLIAYPLVGLEIQDGAKIHPPNPALHEGLMYWGTADTTISLTKPDFDYGGSEYLTLVPDQSSILIKFEQLLPLMGGPNNSIDKAKLILSATEKSKLSQKGTNYKIYQIENSWNEGGRVNQKGYWAATYNARYASEKGNAIKWQKAGLVGSAEVKRLKKATFTVKDNILTIGGIESSIKEFLARNYNNHGWLIVSNNSKPVKFHSREASQAALRPKLDLDVSPKKVPSHANDLGVVFIERYPEYMSWKDAGSYEMKKFGGMDVGIMKEPEFNNVPKTPQVGDQLQYIGVVKNHGSEDLQGFKYAWSINDAVIKTGVYSIALLSQKQAYLWFDFPAPSNLNDHRDEWLTLKVEPIIKTNQDKWRKDLVKENKNNNQLTIFTKARALGIHADETSRKFYLDNYNAVGTYSFEDWIQFQIRYWNQIYFPKSRFKDLFPDGALSRVRIQRISWYRDGDLQGPVHIAFDWRDPRYDGLWGWDFAGTPVADRDKEDWFFRQTLRMPEPSLIHELSHQCFGLIDIYWMTMEKATNAEDGSGGKVKLKDPRDPKKYLTTIGYWPKYGGLMGGGDTRYTPEHEGTGLYSSHSVYGLNVNAPYRGGFFGDFMYDLQTNVSIKITGPAGEACGNVPVLAMQCSYWVGDGIINDDKEIFDTKTNSKGVLQMPNQSIVEDGPVTTVTGHTLRDNPFGRIHVCGFNGQILLRTYYKDKYYYYMLPAWKLNVEYAKGHKDKLELAWQLGPKYEIDTYEYNY